MGQVKREWLVSASIPSHTRVIGKEGKLPQIQLFRSTECVSSRDSEAPMEIWAESKPLIMVIGFSIKNACHQKCLLTFIETISSKINE